MTTDDSSSAQRRRMGCGMLSLLAGGGTLLIVAAAFTLAWARLHWVLDAELARIRASGEPTTPAETEAFYRAPPAERDSTQVWRTALALVDTPRFKEDGEALPFVGQASNDIPPPGQTWDQLDSAEQFLNQYRVACEQLHLATRQGGEVRFPTNFSAGINMPLLHVDQLRPAARLLALESVVAAHRGQNDAAIESIAAMFATANTLEHEPILVSQLVRMALDGMARAQVQWLLSSVELDDGQLRRLDALLAASEFHHPVRRALAGERALTIQTFDNPASLGDYGDVSLRLTPTSDEIACLQIMSEMIAAFDETGPARKQAMDDATKQVARLSEMTAARVRFPLTLLLLPSLKACADAVSRNEADRDATRVAIASERFYLKHGRLPNKLAELVPGFLVSLPDDPFDGASLRYRLDVQEYVVYSVGVNGRDDGGVSDPTGGNSADLVVRMRRKDLAAQTATGD